MTDREIDTEIAEKVMKWQYHGPEGQSGCGEYYMATDGPMCGQAVEEGDFSPSTDIAAAWQVVEKMGNWEAFDFMLTHPFVDHVGMREWVAGWVEYKQDGSYEWRAKGEDGTSPARAICLAALNAVGGRP